MPHKICSNFPGSYFSPAFFHTILRNVCKSFRKPFSLSAKS